jgi:LacI family transcriptional regulator
MKPTGRVTLREVAAAADVSAMTVSNFINGKFGGMRTETRDRIGREIIRLGYRPHSAARSLRLARRLSIGMIIVDEAPTYLADPFTTRVVAGLSNYLSERGYALLLEGLHPQGFDRSSLIADIRTDAICAMLSGSDATRRHYLDKLLRLGQPIVAFQENLRLKDRDLCVIRQDDRSGGRALATHVLQRGAKRLLMLIPSLSWPAISERVAGVRQVVRSRARGCSMRVVRCREDHFDEIQAALAGDIAANGMPDAILAGNDQMGIAAMKLIEARKLAIPRDVLITGFNAFEFWQFTNPVLTTVRSAAYEIGARGGQELLSRLKGDTFARHDIVYSVDVQYGGST